MTPRKWPQVAEQILDFLFVFSFLLVTVVSVVVLLVGLYELTGHLWH